MKRLETSPDKALEVLNKVHFFDHFSRPEKDVLTGFHSHFFFSPKGEIIINEGAYDNSFYILLTGKVTIHKKGSPRLLAALHPGDCFGEISFLTKRPRTTSVKTQIDSIVFEVDRPTLMHMDINIREKLKDNLIHVLVKRLDHMNDLVSKMSLRVI
ncbi:MAG: CRP/FNR family cyclic AMP-dependent transcriptional regulator [Candidatus Azotimanducaceae bacterium]|jgi:CRP/FNR family cyclic AMP-dependent transcriptional regulator